MAPVLETRNITKRFPGVLANDRIDLSLEKGEVLAEVQERCRVLGRGGGYICASAHYIQADTPLENIVAMYTAPRELPPV